VGRPRLIGLLVGASALIALAAPTPALAGVFSWTLPNDFTTAAPGSNPEHKYGAVSWTYEVSGGTLSFSSNADLLGHPGWSDSSGDYIADTGAAIAMQSTSPLAGSPHSVTIQWTNPFPSKQTVAVKSTLTPSLTCTVTQSPSGSSLTLAPGATVSWTLNAPLLPGPVDCTASGGIQITASTPGPTVTLNSPGTAPSHSSVVQLSGTAGQPVFPNSNQVTVAIYSGTKTSGSPLHQVTGTVDSNGNFAVQTPALADGEYTAVASQTSGSSTGQSPAVTFRVKVHPPAVTLFQPPGDVWIGRGRLSFSGLAGHALGDAAKVIVELHRGKSAGGQLVGTRTVKRHGGTWSTKWRGLRLGYYTVLATQTDNAGHAARTAPHTFRLISKTTPFGSSVTVAGNSASIPIGCLASSDQSCRGTVLVVTKGSYRTSSGGPSGPLEVLFANVRIPGGAMGLIGGRVPGPVLAVLRRLHHTRVTVTTKLSHSGRHSVSRVARVS
jgi:hypothetical protein